MKLRADYGNSCAGSDANDGGTKRHHPSTSFHRNLPALWRGVMPALLKACIAQVMRPAVALEYREHGFPKGLLARRSARLVVTKECRR